MITETKLPSNVTVHENDMGYKVYAIHEKPRMREIFLGKGFGKLSNTSIEIYLPHVIYLIYYRDNKYSHMNIYLSTKKVKNADQRSLYPLFFLNCCDGNACLGSKARVFLTKKSLEEVIELVPRLFWESPFNKRYGSISLDLDKKSFYSDDEYSFTNINELI